MKLFEIRKFKVTEYEVVSQQHLAIFDEVIYNCVDDVGIPIRVHEDIIDQVRITHRTDGKELSVYSFDRERGIRIYKEAMRLYILEQKERVKIMEESLNEFEGGYYES